MVDFELKDFYDLEDYRRLIAVLRGPGGCPWDAEQTHASIRRCALEEAYELAQAIDTDDEENLKEELGDVLMQVLIHARMEEERGRFTLDDVADAACKKLIFRHPHVFGDAAAEDAEAVLRTWDEQKRREKHQKTAEQSMTAVAETLPALWRAEKICKKAEDAGLLQPDAAHTAADLRAQTERLCAAVEGGTDAGEALGRLLFTAAEAARLSGTDPEQELHRACERAISQFAAAEKRA